MVGDVERTAEPEPVTAEMVVPFILKTLPVPAVSNVLFVKVSVVARPTNVSVEVGRVRVPVLLIVEMIGDVSVLLVNVCVAASVTTVPLVDGKANDVESVPVKVSELLAVKVFPEAIVKVPVVVVMARPFTLDGVIAPRVSVMAGVVVAFATEPETPLAVTTDTVVTVPEPTGIEMSVVPSKSTPLIVRPVCRAVAVPALPVMFV